MSANKTRSSDYETLRRSPAKKVGANSDEPETLKPRARQTIQNETQAARNLNNPKSVKSNSESERGEIPQNVRSAAVSAIKESARAENSFSATNRQTPEATYAELQKEQRLEKKIEKDYRLLGGETWLARNNHGLTYAGIFLFTLIVYFRPYELFDALSGLTSMALVVAVATLIIYLPSQFAGEGSLLSLTTEVKCLLFMAFWALLTIPIAVDASLAWETFNKTFSKVLVIFIVMVSTVQTRERLKGLMWLAIGAGVMISCQALYLYQQGIFKTEGYRVNIDSGGMFGNPNDMALHLVIFIPVAIALGLAARNRLARLLYFAVALLMIGGVVVTQSRGGFLGLIAVGAVLVWKLGKNQRFKAVLIAAVVGLIFIAAAPGNYGMRILSIFIPSLDSVGSTDQRGDLLKQSLIVTLRNPQGIGMGNFSVVSPNNLETHNAYTQVSSELGWLCAAAYVLLMVSPVRKLAVIERRLFSADKENAWLYYLAVGVQASIVAYMVTSFFGPVAYNWYVYYPIAYAVCLRRIYRIRFPEKDAQIKTESAADNAYFGFSSAPKRQVQ